MSQLVTPEAAISSQSTPNVKQGTDGVGPAPVPNDDEDGSDIPQHCAQSAAALARSVQGELGLMVVPDGCHSHLPDSSIAPQRGDIHGSNDRLLGVRQGRGPRLSGLRLVWPGW